MCEGSILASHSCGHAGLFEAMVLGTAADDSHVVRMGRVAATMPSRYTAHAQAG